MAISNYSRAQNASPATVSVIYSSATISAPDPLAARPANEAAATTLGSSEVAIVAGPVAQSEVVNTGRTTLWADFSEAENEE
jgi:hypothetical protein